jgi:hypothetical protein
MNTDVELGTQELRKEKGQGYYKRNVLVSQENSRQKSRSLNLNVIARFLAKWR